MKLRVAAPGEVISAYGEEWIVLNVVTKSKVTGVSYMAVRRDQDLPAPIHFVLVPPETPEKKPSIKELKKSAYLKENR